MTTTIEPGTIHHAVPGTLLLERNIRDAKPSPELVESVRAVGVLEPITARLNDDGALVVRFGHRRALAAVEAGLDTVPVYVVGHDDTADDAEVWRVITQRDENTHRSGLTAGEEAGAVAQLAAFGLSADQIAEQARITKDHVATALRVNGSTLASKAASRYEALTLEQAATVAEFEDDTTTAKELIVTAIERPGHFAHMAQRKRDDRDRNRLIAEARERLAAEGVTVLDQSPGYSSPITALHYLVDAETDEPVTEDTHAQCPGRTCTITISTVYVDEAGGIVPDATVETQQEEYLAAAVAKARADAAAAGENPDDIDDEDLWHTFSPETHLGLRKTKRGMPYWYCADPTKHGHKNRYGTSGSTKPAAADMTDEEREAARKARALVIENNKAWDSAETVRRDWLREFFKRKTAPKGTAAFTATALSKDRQALTDYRATTVTAELLGAPVGDLPKHIDRLLKGASENRAHVVALAQVLASIEATLSQQSWRGDGKDSTAGRYLRFLTTCGYELSDVEKFAISSKTA